MSQLCLGCMCEINGEQICPHCGFDKDSVQSAPFLPLGALLQERYLVGKQIDNSVEGAYYIGYDNFMHSPIVIHEFLPAGICGRAPGNTEIVIREGSESTFASLQKSFLKYYRTLARLRELSSITPIYDIFSENGTCYTVEEKLDCITFGEYIQRSGGSIDWNTARPMFMPVLSALTSIHESGITHFGINPESLVVTPAGKLRLQCFSIKDIRQQNRIIDAELFDGCSAPEQYDPDAHLDESTDVYGFTATLFYALTGRLPEDGDKRKPDGKLPLPTAVFKQLPPHVVTALAGGLQVLMSTRTKTCEELKAQLSAAPTVRAIQTEATRNAAQAAAVKSYNANKKNGIPGFAWVLISVLSALLILTVAAIFFVGQMQVEKSDEDDTLSTTSASSAVTSEGISEGISDPNSMVVPNLCDKEYQRVVEEASTTNEYTVIKESEEMFSNTVKEGNVVSQIPEAGSIASKGSTIVVVVSKGPQQRELPSINSLSLEEAIATLSDMGFIVNKTEVANDQIAKGSVIGYKDYKAGDTAPYGAKLTITVSLGSEDSSSNSAT